MRTFIYIIITIPVVIGYSNISFLWIFPFSCLSLLVFYEDRYEELKEQYFENPWMPAGSIFVANVGLFVYATILYFVGYGVRLLI